MHSTVRFVAVVSTLMLSSVMIAMAQMGDWRVEEVSSTTRQVQVRELNDTYVAYGYDGYYAFDEGTRSWKFLGKATEDLGPLVYLMAHPDGTILVRDGSQNRTIDVRTGELGPRLDGVATALIGDTLTAYVSESRIGQDSVRLVGVWTSLTTNSVVWRDSVLVPDASAYGPAIMVSDTALIFISRTTVARFPFRGPATFTALPDTVGSGPPTIWIDADRSHVIVPGRRTWLYSVDDGRSWTSIQPASRSKVHKVVPTRNADIVLVLKDSILCTYHVAAGTTDTLLGPDHFSMGMHVADGPLGVMASTKLGMFLIAADGSIAPSGKGLPVVSAHDLLASTDGIIASTDDGKLSRLVGGEWRVVPLDYERTKGFGWEGTPQLQGSRTVNDFWYTTPPWVHHVTGNNSIPLEALLLPESGNYVPSHASYVTCITNMDDSRQVAWWSGSSPLRQLYTDPELTYLVAFSDNVLVAITASGTLFRTVAGQVDRWERIAFHAIEVNPYNTSVDVKGRHALLRTGNWLSVTHDSGRTWQWKSLDRPGKATITATGVVLLAEFLGPETRGDLRVQRLVDGAWTEVARLDRASFDARSEDIVDVAFDDVGQRFYVTTYNWVRSVVLTVTSIEEEVAQDYRSSPRSSVGHGVYDLLGRFICSSKEEITGPGLYIIVGPDGTSLYMH